MSDFLIDVPYCANLLNFLPTVVIFLAIPVAFPFFFGIVILICMYALYNICLLTFSVLLYTSLTEHSFHC